MRLVNCFAFSSGSSRSSSKRRRGLCSIWLRFYHIAKRPGSDKRARRRGRSRPRGHHHPYQWGAASGKKISLEDVVRAQQRKERKLAVKVSMPEEVLPHRVNLPQEISRSTVTVMNGHGNATFYSGEVMRVLRREVC